MNALRLAIVSGLVALGFILAAHATAFASDLRNTFENRVAALDTLNR